LNPPHDRQRFYAAPGALNMACGGARRGVARKSQARHPGVSIDKGGRLKSSLPPGSHGVFAMLRPIAALFAAAVAVSGAAHAQSAADRATDAAIACLDVGDPAARLSCLEDATREIKATRIRKESAEESAAADAMGAVVAAEGASEEELFGAEALSSTRHAKNEERKKMKLEATVVEFRVNPFGVVTAVLDNGQVWRQLNSDDEKLHLPKSDKVFTVTVKKGALGNYIMKVNELKRTIRVKRIQ
jgi:hypothetical protein